MPSPTYTLRIFAAEIDEHIALDRRFIGRGVAAVGLLSKFIADGSSWAICIIG